MTYACEGTGHLADWMRQHRPETRLLALGAEQQVSALVQLFCFGMHGFCNTRTELDRLRTVLEQVCTGALVYPCAVQAAIRDMLAPMQLRAEDKPLPDRHVALMKILKRNDSPTYDVAALEIGVSVHTIYKYVDEVCKRYGVKGKSGVVKLAVQLGL